jgi:hydrogenase nickel incorporation protein HypA/HybF
MHEASIVAGLLDIVREEMDKRELTKLVMVKVKYGKLAGVMPEAMDMAFEAMTMATPFEGARLELEEVPAVLACRICKAEFQPGDNHILCVSCPACGEEFGHTLLSGKELHLERLEAE